MFPNRYIAADPHTAGRICRVVSVVLVLVVSLVVGFLQYRPLSVPVNLWRVDAYLGDALLVPLVLHRDVMALCPATLSLRHVLRLVFAAS